MTTTDRQTASHNAAAAFPSSITFGWVLRRSALWLFIVATGVSAACLLYAAASSAESSAQRSAAAASQAATLAK